MDIADFVRSEREHYIIGEHREKHKKECERRGKWRRD